MGCNEPRARLAEEAKFMRVFPSCAVALWLTVSSGSAQAAGWVRPAGESYLKLAAGIFRTAGYWELDGALVEAPPLEYTNRSASLYAELGLTEGVAVGFYLPFIQAENTDVFDITYARTSLGDLDTFIQVQLLHQGRWALATSVLLRLPLYAGVLTGVNTQSGWVSESLPAFSEFFPAIGDGSVDVVPTLQAGLSLSPVPGWLTLEIGPRFRDRGFGVTLNYGISAGVYLWPERLAITGRWSGWERLTRDNLSPTSRLMSVGGGIALALGFGLALEVEAYYVPEGSFVARGGGGSVGLSYRGPVLPGDTE